MTSNPKLVDATGGENRAAPRLVVGIGASAGGVPALRALFRDVPGDAGITYIVVLHLSPTHPSHLAEVLEGSTTLPVEQVTASVTLEPDHIYVTAPNGTLAVNGLVLTLTEATRLEHRRAPIDIFFRTLADAHGARAAAVVLSGTGADGAAGLSRVKAAGGLTIAQDPETAEHPEMPAAAVETGAVDVVLVLEQIAQRLVAYADQVERDGDLPDEPAAAADSAPVFADAAAADAQALRDVLAALRTRTGQDFSSYKTGTVLRRIHRRMHVRQYATIAEYAAAVRDDPAEPQALMKDLLIGVTAFFRDPTAWEALERRVIEPLVASRRGQDQIRVWSAGCATGEEAYSLAMLLTEALDRAVDPPQVLVFATDLDAAAIAAAREGVYRDADVIDIPEDRLNRFFERTGRGYQVRRAVRDIVLFAAHNLLQDPPFSRLDLVACRNVLIYLNRPAQERVLDTFHFALRAGGCLLLGASESPEIVTDLFATTDKEAHLFESRTVPGRLGAVRRDIAPAPPRFAAAHGEDRSADRMLPADLHHRLIEAYAPPSVVITGEHRVVHVSEGAARYLRIGAGEPSRDLMQLVLPELRIDLRAALRNAAVSRAPVDVAAVQVTTGAGTETVRLQVRPVLRPGDPADGYFLVVFVPEQVERPPTVELASRAVEMNELDDELARVRLQLRVTIEQYETQVEEAKASNEELQAVNEEMRSSAEELEASREELLSVNEELTTVNDELKSKVEELATANNNLLNFIGSSDVAAIFLDRQLRVRLSTPRVQALFSLLPGDRGRRLTDLTSRLQYTSLVSDVEEVLERLTTVEREVMAETGATYLMRILPYRTLDDRIDGVMLTFVDVTSRVRAEHAAQVGEQRLRLLIDSAVDYAIFTMTSDGTIDSWNTGAQRMFGFTADEIVGRSGELLFTPEDRAAGVPAGELARAAATGRAEDERWHLRKDGTRLYCSGVTTRLGDTAALGFAKIARDLTAQQRAEERLREAHAQLEDNIQERTRELQQRVEAHAVAEMRATMLVRKLVSAQEEERARISRDLHDQLGQQLTALRLALDRHRTTCAGAAGEEFERTIALTQAVDDQIDFLAWELRPAALDDLGLTAALDRFVQDWSAHYRVDARVEASPALLDQLPPTAQTTLYRIAQEALNNVAKHAHATRVDLMIERRDGELVMVIEDDGVGFDPTDPGTIERGIGLAGMRERAALIAGSLDIESTPGHGTSLFVRCPLRPGAAETGHA